MINSKQLTLIDKLLIGIQMIIIGYSILLNTLEVLANYFNSVSPFIPETFHWTLSKPNLYILTYWIVIAFVTWKLYRNYTRVKFILLIIGTLVAEFVLWNVIETAL
ncbi:MAG: hypothetical protein RJQ09_08130 [Cyclobacteriaceae bacterium]